MIELLKIVIGSAVKTFNWDVGPMDTLFGTTATWPGEFPEFFPDSSGIEVTGEREGQTHVRRSKKGEYHEDKETVGCGRKRLSGFDNDVTGDGDGQCLPGFRICG